MKKLTAMVLACLMLAGILSGCASTANDEKVEYRWKMALNSTEGDNAYDTGVLFAQKIKELTDGRVRVDLYGGAQLGITAEVLEGMYAGVADVMCESIGTLATFTPLANIEAIVNQPDAAILGVCAVEDELVMDDEGSISKHQVMRLSFTYDHRLIDGAVAAKFVMALRDLLEKPMRIIL